MGAGGGPPCKSKNTTFKIFKKKGNYYFCSLLGLTETTFEISNIPPSPDYPETIFQIFKKKCNYYFIYCRCSLLGLNQATVYSIHGKLINFVFSFVTVGYSCVQNSIEKVCFKLETRVIIKILKNIPVMQGCFHWKKNQNCRLIKLIFQLCQLSTCFRKNV